MASNFLTVWWLVSKTKHLKITRNFDLTWEATRCHFHSMGGDRCKDPPRFKVTLRKSHDPGAQQRNGCHTIECRTGTEQSTIHTDLKITHTILHTQQERVRRVHVDAQSFTVGRKVPHPTSKTHPCDALRDGRLRATRVQEAKPKGTDLEVASPTLRRLV